MVHWSQAERTKVALENIPFDVCVSSPIARARECADIVWAGHDNAIVYDDNLKEADLGWLQGLTNKECARDHTETYGECPSRWNLCAAANSFIAMKRVGDTKEWKVQDW